MILCHGQSGKKHNRYPWWIMTIFNIYWLVNPPGIIHQEGSTAATAHLTCLARPWKSQATCIATLQIGRRILRKPCPWLAENFWSSLNDQTFSGWKLPKWLEPGKCDAVIPFSNLTSTNFSQITTYLCNHLQEHIYSNNIVNKLVSTSFRNSLGVSPLMSVEEKNGKAMVWRTNGHQWNVHRGFPSIKQPNSGGSRM